MTDPDVRTGFTPIFQWVVNATGNFSTAAAYGLVWRYAQMRDRHCHASCSHLAAELGWSRQRIMRHLGVLRDAGLIVCANPDEQGVPRRYFPVSQAQWLAALSYAAPAAAGVPDGLPPSCDTPLCPAPQHPRVPPPDTPCHPTAPDPVPPSHTSDTTRKPSNTQVTETTNARRAARRGRPRRPRPAHTPEGVLTVNRIVSFRPPKILHDRIASLVPPGTPAHDLEPYFREWCARGYNPRNLAWLFEWYAARAIPPPLPPPRARAAPTPPPAQAIEVWDRWAQYQQALAQGENPDDAKRRLGL